VSSPLLGAMDEYYRVPTLALLSILVAVFAALYARSRTPRTLLWLIGWTLAITRLALQASAHGRHGVGLAVSNTAMALAALMLLGSLSPIFIKGKTEVLHLVGLALPLTLFSVLTSLHPSPGIFLRIIDCVSLIAAVVVAVHWSAQKHYLPRWFALSVALSLGGLCIYLALIGEYDLVLRLAHSGISLMTAVLVLVTYRRWSPGVIFTAAGLLIWSSPMVVDFLLHQGDPLWLLYLRAVNLMKVVTAVGMIVLVTEDELIRNETAQKRDRRVRAEMEQYSKLTVLASPNRDFGTDFDHVCEVISEASRFAQAAILLRSVDQQFRLVGRAGMEGALAGALDAMGQRLTPENLEVFRNRNHSVENGSNAVLDLRPFMAPGDDLEQLGFVRAHAIPMGTPGAGLHGVLLLNGLKAPDESLASEDLLPLELLMARLTAVHENNLLLRRVAQSEKLAGLGQLAGGVAHELNNPLTVVMGYAELIEESGVDDATRRNVAVIRSESQRMKHTIESLTRFWKSSPSEQTSISVEQILIDIGMLRKPELERVGIELEVVITRNLPRIRANGDQMRQVFLQIISNAATALQGSPTTQEKKIRISATATPDRVQVAISDTGPGFPHPNRVFDPFFTTKKPGEGTGLGLSLCYSIVREHGGEISAFNLQPHGAAVAIEMPVDVATNEVSVAGEVFSQ
jgi:two-component system NtrC family sensor kinase